MPDPWQVGQSRGVVPALAPVPEQACFRIDFADFLNGLPDRDRRMALALARGDTAGEVARRFGVTPARVTQLRRAWHRRWSALNGEPSDVPRP